MLRLVKRGEVLFDLELFDGWDEELLFLNKDKSGNPTSFLMIVSSGSCVD
jgi:hypothetical protein